MTILNEGTALTRTITSDASGEYTAAPSLPTGRYTMMTEMAGFKALALSNIDVGVDQRVRIDLKLDPEGVLHRRSAGATAAARSARPRC